MREKFLQSFFAYHMSDRSKATILYFTTKPNDIPSSAVMRNDKMYPRPKVLLWDRLFHDIDLVQRRKLSDAKIRAWAEHEKIEDMQIMVERVENQGMIFIATIHENEKQVPASYIDAGTVDVKRVFCCVWSLNGLQIDHDFKYEMDEHLLSHYLTSGLSLMFVSMGEDGKVWMKTQGGQYAINGDKYTDVRVDASIFVFIERKNKNGIVTRTVDPLQSKIVMTKTISKNDFVSFF